MWLRALPSLLPARERSRRAGLLGTGKETKGAQNLASSDPTLGFQWLAGFCCFGFLFVCLFFYFGVRVWFLSFFPLLVFVWLEKVRAGRERNDRSVSLRRPTVRTGRAYSKQRPPLHVSYTT